MTKQMKAMKKTSGKKFPAVNKTIPKMKATAGQTKFMTVKQRLNLQRRITHFENTKNLPTI